MRVESVGLFRFLAAMVIVLSHFSGTSAAKSLAFGSAGLFVNAIHLVTFFFVLSGFVNFLAYGQQVPFNPRHFAASRIARAIPLCYFSLALTLLLVSVANLPIKPIEVFLHLTFLQAWIPQYALTLNFVTWTISVDIFLYVTFPFILWWMRKYRIDGNRLLLCAVVVHVITQVILSMILSSPDYPGEPSTAHNFTHLFPLFHFSSFLFGIYAAYMVVHEPDRVRWFSSTPLLLAVFVVLFSVIVFAKDITRTLGFVLVTPSGTAPLFMLMLIALAMNRGLLVRFLENRFFVYLGSLSYAVYLFQILVWLIYRNTFGKVLDLSVFEHLCAGIVMLLLFSVFSHHVVEKPANLFFRKHLKRGFDRLFADKESVDSRQVKK